MPSLQVINISMVTIPNNDDTTLRDFRHAHNFYTQNNHIFSPKVKFLYHVVFALNGLEVREKAPNTFDNLKEIAIMAKEVDLPKFRANIETKQQYNRKKNIQTRIDYEPVRFTFHDDNNGLTRKMLEEYYKYYYRDGKKDGGNGIPTDFSPLDKYQSLNAKYGLDNEVEKPFFYYIKIFQFAQREWYSYTLINPLLTSWEHDNLEYASSEPVANTINIAYEGVLYNHGAVSDGQVSGFDDVSLGYDDTDSFLVDAQEYHGGFEPSTTSADAKLGPGLFTTTTTTSTAGSVLASAVEAQSQFDILASSIGGNDTGIPSTIFPTQDPANFGPTAEIQPSTLVVRDPETLVSVMSSPQNASALNSLTLRALSNGVYSQDWNINNFSQFNTLPQNDKQVIQQDILTRLNSDPRIQTIASTIISQNNII